jgi:hypothetical protein
MNVVSKELRVQRWMRRIIGTLVFTTGLLGYLVSPYWLFGTMFIGLNMLQFGFTDWCPMKIALEKLIEE